MLHAGLDLSRKRLDVRVLTDSGDTALESCTPSDRDGLDALVQRVARFAEPVRGVIEAMNGARFVHDHLELGGWEVEIADAARVKGLAPLACKTDRIDAWVLAELSRRDLVPAIWLPTPGIRAERERARWRLHLVKRRTALKNRVHSIVIAFGYPKLASDLFGIAGRSQLEALEFPEPWRSHLLAALRLIDELDIDIVACERDLRCLGADHRYVELLVTAPGIGWVLGYTIAAEIGDIGRFASAKKLTGYTGLCPKVDQSGESDWRGPLAKNGPRYLRWALIEAAVHAAQHPCYRHHYERTKRRCGKQRGAKIARVEIARKLATAIWHMLTRGEPFAPAGPHYSLAA
jgi:transposase